MFGLEDLDRISSGQSDLCQIFDHFSLINPQDHPQHLEGSTSLPTADGTPSSFQLARQALFQRRQLAKVEILGGRTLFLLAIPLFRLSPPLVLVLEKDITNGPPEMGYPSGGDIPDVMEELGNLASTDPFTGLYNKNTLVHRLGKEMEKARTSGQPLFAAMLDIDDFKQINDRYGHTFGDEVIRQIVALLRQYAGGGNSWSARFGGDEFLTIFPGGDPKTVARRCRELEQAIARYPFQKEGQPVQVTASIGMAEFQPEADTLPRFLDRVDRAMYENKRKRKQAKL